MAGNTEVKSSVSGASGEADARQTRVRRVLLGCGIVSSLLYIATNVVGALQFPGYSSTSQTISELIAIGAPSRPIVATLMVLYSLLLYAFAAGVWQCAGHQRALRVAAVGMASKEVLGLVVTVWFPMHLREVLAAGGATLSDSMHMGLTMLGTVFMLIAMVSGAVAFGRNFRIYTIATIVAFVVCGILGFADAGAMAADLPTPWQGVLERINAYGYMLWIVVLAVALLRRERERLHGLALDSPNRAKLGASLSPVGTHGA